MSEEEAVEKAALDLYNTIRIRRHMKPVDHIGANDTPLCNEVREDVAVVLNSLIAAGWRYTPEAADTIARLEQEKAEAFKAGMKRAAEIADSWWSTNGLARSPVPLMEQAHNYAGNCIASAILAEAEKVKPTASAGSASSPPAA